jgi:hypothetical protein
MRAENRHILLIIDNFSGHFIEYTPSNIQIEYLDLRAAAQHGKTSPRWIGDVVKNA